jgi:exopolysaccharide biosynthesis protein
MKLGLTLLAPLLAALLSTPVRAQIVKPIDPTKQADVSGKTVSFGDVQFDTLSQPARNFTDSSISKGTVKFQDVDQRKSDIHRQKMDFRTLDMSRVSEPTMTKANFTAKRAAVDMSSEPGKQVEQTKKKAPISQRQIRPFTPSGEEDLKHQLNEPPLAVH